MKKIFNPADWRESEGGQNGTGSSTGKQARSPEPPATTTYEDIENLTRQIEAQALDITGDYSQWLEIGFALKEALGEGGRQYFHRLSRFYHGYSAAEADRQYDKCLSSGGEGIQPRTLSYFARQAGISIKSSQQSQAGGVSTPPIKTRDQLQNPRL